jgi:hypothetical protein
MTINKPMFPPRAESVDSLSPHPAIGQPETECRISESRKPAEGLSRRVVLAGVAAGGAALGAGLPLPASSAATARRYAEADPILGAIEAHLMAVAAHGEAVEIEMALEVSLPDDQRQSDLTLWEEKIVETDDPRWIAAVRARWEASSYMDDLAIDLVNIEPTTTAGVEALLRYYAEHEDGLFPDGVDNDDGSSETFGSSLIRHAADSLRKIAPPGQMAEQIDEVRS